MKSTIYITKGNKYTNNWIMKQVYENGGAVSLSGLLGKQLKTRKDVKKKLQQLEHDGEDFTVEEVEEINV